MAKSWTILISFGLFLLLVISAYDFVQSLTGRNNLKKYQIQQISDDLGEDTLKFIQKKGEKIYIYENNI